MNFHKILLVLLLVFLVLCFSVPLNAAEFKDVNSTDWFAEAVDYCSDKGYFYGMSSTTFEPYTTMNRAMLVTVLYRHAGEPDVNIGTDFPDVPDDEWYSAAVSWAAESGVVTGYEDGSFRPLKAVSRQEIMSLIHRYVLYMDSDFASETDLRLYNSFYDIHNVGNWAVSSVQWCTSVGLICGNAGYISPTANSTRVEIATVLLRLDSYFADDMVTITSTYGDGGSIVPWGKFTVVKGSAITFHISVNDLWRIKTADLSGTPLPLQNMYVVNATEPSQVLTVTFRKLVGNPYSGYGQLVNRTYPIPNASSFKLTDLKTVNYGNVQLRAEAANAMNKMVSAYKAAYPGSTLYAQSGYRSHSTQIYLYNRQIDRKNGNIYNAGTVSAVPGTSEHELGLAVDLTYDGSLLQSFGNSTQGKWLSAHCMEYGFILRYPADKERVVGIIYEPWHFRYVGKDIAADMKSVGATTLEEYYGMYLADEDLTPYLPYLK